MMLRFLFSLFLIAFLSGCGGGSNHQKNMEKLDKVYGKCDNPYRQYRDLEYNICKDKERAAGPDGKIGDPLDINKLISGIGKSQTVIANSDTNNYLWDASIKVLNSYSFKIIDFDGGFIETNWIIEEGNPNQRCLIKTHITSAELVSNGVTNKIICELKKDDAWYTSDENFGEAEKDLTLVILKEASNLSSQNSD